MKRVLSSHLIEKGDGALGRTLYNNLKNFDQEEFTVSSGQCTVLM